VLFNPPSEKGGYFTGFATALSHPSMELLHFIAVAPGKIPKGIVNRLAEVK
jgi:hypothetical protein